MDHVVNVEILLMLFLYHEKLPKQKSEKKKIQTKTLHYVLHKVYQNDENFLQVINLMDQNLIHVLIDPQHDKSIRLFDGNHLEGFYLILISIDSFFNNNRKEKSGFEY